MNNRTPNVVVDVYQLGRTQDGYEEKYKEKIKEKAVMTRSYIEDMMAPIPYLDDKGKEFEKPAWSKTGKLFVIDEQATDEWHIKFEAKQEQMREKEEFERAKASGILEKALTSVVRKSNETKVSLPSGTPDNSWEDEEIKEWLKKENVSFGGRSGKEKLLKKVSENL